MASYDDDDIDNLDFLPEEIESSFLPIASNSNGGGSHQSHFNSSFPLGTSSFSETIPVHQSKHIQQKIQRWICVYPIYFDLNRSRYKGRRIPKQYAKDNITVWHLAKSLERLGLPCVVEQSKMHPRDNMILGRVRTEIYSDVNPNQRFPFHDQIHNRKTLFFHMALQFPSVESAVQELIEERKRYELEESQKMMQEMEKLGLPSLPGLGGMGGGMPNFPGLSNDFQSLLEPKPSGAETDAKNKKEANGSSKKGAAVGSTKKKKK